MNAEISNPSILNPILSLDGVFKRRGQVQALQGLSFIVERGEILALLGPNGAGKSTAIQHILGLMRPDQGQVRLFGENADSMSARTRVGCTPQDTGFLEHLKVREILSLIAAHYPKPADIDATLQAFGLQTLAQRKSSALSGGQKRCLALACAFVGQPDLVVLDEPTTGLDIEIRRHLWDQVRAFTAKGGTVIFTTHYLEEAEALATRIVVINEGRAIANGCVRSIKSRLGVRKVIFQSDDSIVLPIEARAERDGTQYRVWTTDADNFVRELCRNHQYKDLEVHSARLEDAFLTLVDRGPK